MAVEQLRIPDICPKTNIEQIAQYWY